MLHYEESGSGQPVLLLHGFPLNNQTWTQVERRLVEHYRVIMPNLPGHGASPLMLRSRPSTINGMAEEVLHLMDYLEVQEAVVAGHSMGGYVALAMAKLAPGRVRGLALICTQARADTPEAKKGRYDLAERVGREGSTIVAKAMAPKLFGHAVGNDRPFYRQVEQLMQSNSPEGIQSALVAMAERPDMRDFLSEIAVKTLVLAGTEDQIFSADRAEEMAEAIKRSTLKFIEGAGHMPMLEQPNATSDAILEWLVTV